MHRHFCPSIKELEKKRPSEDHYLAAFFPCDTNFPEIFWMHAFLHEDGELEIRHDRPNMLEYFDEFGHSTSGPSLRHKKMTTSTVLDTHPSPHTVVAATGEPHGQDQGQEQQFVARKWINRSRLSFSLPGYLQCVFYPTLMYAVEQNEKDGITCAADLSIRDLYDVISVWCVDPINPSLSASHTTNTIPTVLFHPWWDQQGDIGINSPLLPAYSPTIVPYPTFALARLFQLGIPWYIRIYPSNVAVPIVDSTRDEPFIDLVEPLKYVLALGDWTEDDQPKSGVVMFLANLWPRCVILDGRGAIVELKQLLFVCKQILARDSLDEATFRQEVEKSGDMSLLSPYKARPNAVSWPQEQPNMNFWLEMTHGTSLVPDLMAQLDGPPAVRPLSEGVEVILKQSIQQANEIALAAMTPLETVKSDEQRTGGDRDGDASRLPASSEEQEQSGREKEAAADALVELSQSSNHNEDQEGSGTESGTERGDE